MQVKIRKATLKDLKEIQKLNLMLFEKEYGEYDETLSRDWTFGKNGTKYFEKGIQDEKHFFVWVALVGSKIVGYLAGDIISGEDYRKKMKIAERENMFVLPKFRGKGIGTKLLREFLSWCKQKGADRIKLVAYAKNKQAINLYRTLGFENYSLTLEKDI